MQTLFDQLSDSERDAVSALIGFHTESAGFRNTLREINALPDGFTIGDVAIAWLEKRLDEIKRLRALRPQLA